jgi:hypothetical protein
VSMKWHFGQLKVRFSQPPFCGSEPARTIREKQRRQRGVSLIMTLTTGARVSQSPVNATGGAVMVHPMPRVYHRLYAP